MDLAKRFNGEIINGDAMQLYRGLPIITNKISVEEREGVPHHLIDFISLEEETWHIGRFRSECLRLIHGIHSRGKIPILVGGTSYYVQSVLFHDGLVDYEMADQTPGQDEQSTRDWAILDGPVEAMLAKLREVDPIMAERWHINEDRKIRRSLEIYLKTGRPASEIYAEQQRQREAKGTIAGQLRYPTLVFWVHAEREKLHKRLDTRVDKMVEQGLIPEAQSLSEYLRDKESQGLQVDRTRGIWVSIGFKEMEPYFNILHAGNSSDEQIEALKRTCIESVKTSTRQYSTYQTRWIRLKLWTALANAGATDQLYILDGTDPNAWDSCITEPSERIVQGFLDNGTLPKPESLSALAQQTLEERTKTYNKDGQAGFNVKQIPCEPCGKMLMGQEQWDLHVRGYAHRRTIKKTAKREQRQKYLQSRASETIPTDET